MPELTTIEDVMNGLPGAFQPEKAGGIAATLAFHVTGEQPGDWVVDIRNGACRVRQGETDDPNVSLTVDSADFLDMLNGSLDPMAAFMRGKLQLRGDVTLAMKLPGLFRRS